MLNWDPYDAYVAHEDSLWRDAEKREKCACCGEPIYDDCYDLRDYPGGGVICEHCLRDYLLDHPAIIYALMDEADIAPDDGDDLVDIYYALCDAGVVDDHRGYLPE